MHVLAGDWNRLLDWFSNGQSHADGEGIQTSFAHTWDGPPWLTLLLLILLVVFLVRTYRHEPLGGRRRWIYLATTRLVIFGLVIFMMYGWVEHRHRTELPELVIAVDTSGSMATVDAYRDARIDEAVRRHFSSDPSRLGQAKSLLAADRSGWLARLRQRYRVKLVTIGDAVRNESLETSDDHSDLNALEATDETSRLGEAIHEIIDRQRGRSTAAIILLTDGIATDGPTISEVALYARSRSLPLHIVGLGSEQPPRDVRLSDLLVDDIAFVGDILNFDVHLYSVGLAGRRATIRLRRDGEPAPLREVTVDLSDGNTPLTIRLPHRPEEEGDFNYVVEVDNFSDEPNHENNRLARRISIRNSTIRVLLVQSAPSYEYRYLKNLLARATKQGAPDEEAFDLTTVLQEADLDYIDTVAAKAFPVKQDALFEYDVIVFGDANPAYFSRSVLESVREFVEERGGGVIFVAGPRYFPKRYEATPLATLLPFDLATASLPSVEEVANDAFRVRPTGLGLDSPTFQIGDSTDQAGRVWSQLPELRWLLEIPEVNPTAMVLAEHPIRRNLVGRPLPVILMHFVGAGKVIFHATDETYLWARYQGTDRFYARYWYQTIRYLSRSKLLADRRPIEIVTDSQQYAKGDPVQLRVRFRDERLAPADDKGVTVSLESQQGRRLSVVLSRVATDRGLFETTLSDLAVGTYQAQLAAPLVSQPPLPFPFSVESLMSEHSRLEMAVSDLEEAAAVSRGRFYTIRNVSRLLNALPSGDQVRIESSPPRPIWNSSWLACLFVVLIGMEWILRKRAGLL